MISTWALRFWITTVLPTSRILKPASHTLAYVTFTTPVNISSWQEYQQQPICDDSRIVCPTVLRSREVERIRGAREEILPPSPSDENDLFSDTAFSELGLAIFCFFSGLLRKGTFRYVAMLLSLYVLQDAATTELSLLERIGEWYWSMLEEYPVWTKVLSTAILATIGDWIAQYTELNLEATKAQTYSMRRTLSVFLEGLLLSGPMMHVFYEILERLLPTAGNESLWLATVVHVVADGLVLDSCSIASTFFFTGVLEGISLNDLVGQLQTDYLSSLRVSWLTSAILFPVQFWCFWKLPHHSRVLSVNLMDILWDAVMSFSTHRNRNCCRYQAI